MGGLNLKLSCDSITKQNLNANQCEVSVGSFFYYHITLKKYEIISRNFNRCSQVSLVGLQVSEAKF